MSVMLATSPAVLTDTRTAVLDGDWGAGGGGGGGTPIVGYPALGTFLASEGEDYARFEAYLADTAQDYTDFEAGSITEEALSAWFTANP